MWSLYHRAKALSTRPSQLLEIEDSLAAYMFDSAVVTLGTVLENALMETVETGSGTNKQRKPRYTLSEVLGDDFHLPRAGMEPVAPGNIKGTSDGGMMVDSV